MLLSAAICLILFLSDFGLMGAFGAEAGKFQFGLCGRFAYVLPLLLFFAVVYLVANIPDRVGGAVLRISLCAVVFVCLCGLAQLFGGHMPAGSTLADYYAYGTGEAIGGALGGLMIGAFRPVVGELGAAVLMISLGIICIVAVTGLSLVGPIRRTGETAAANVKVANERRRERRAYNRLRRRAELASQYDKARDRREQLEKEYEAISDVIMRGGRGAAGGPLTSSILDYDLRMDSKGLRDGSGLKAPKNPFDLEIFSGKKNDTADRDSAARSGSARRAGTSKGASGTEPRRPAGIVYSAKEERSLKELEELDAAAKKAADVSSLLIEPAKDAEDFIFEDLGDDLSESGTGDHGKDSEKGRNKGANTGSTGFTSVYNTGAPESAAAGSADDIIFEGDFEDIPFEESTGPVKIWREGAAKDGSSGVTFKGGKSGSSRNNAAGGMSASSSGSSRNNTAGGPSASRENASDPEDAIPAAVSAVPAPPAKPYVIPSTSLLKSGPKAARASENELRTIAVKLQQTLASYGVGVTVTNVSCGPTVTRYELKPDQGVRVNQVLSRVDDIQLNLAASEIRIEAPIPGKSAIGIEVPNSENQTVYLKELIESPEFRRAQSKVCFAVGRDIGGRIIVADIDRMPHLLIAGATGSGKSVCINTIIMSILYKAKPEEVRMIMIDPKVVELSVYNGIPHLMIPVVTDPKKAANALQWAVTEMSNRYKAFAKYNVRDIVSYNRLASEPGHDEDMRPMPRILIIVDELADLMMVSPKEVEGCIQRLAQLARAAGLHLILATQRPSVNVITGVIKANVPSRLAFAVSSSVDSRTILDMGGAEKLLGKGDMLFHLAGWPKPVRIQGAFVSDGEIMRVVDFLKDNAGEESLPAAESSESLMTQIEAGGDDDSESGAEQRDELFERCGRFLIEKGKGTSNILQRTFRIGFNRAARILDQLTEAGVLGPDEGTKPRKVLVTLEEFEEMLEKGL